MPAGPELGYAFAWAALWLPTIPVARHRPGALFPPSVVAGVTVSKDHREDLETVAGRKVRRGFESLPLR